MTIPPETAPKDIVLAAQTALFQDFDAAKAQDLLAASYIQHNPGVPTGRDTIIGFVPALQGSGITVQTHRVLVEGDLVAVHNSYGKADLFGGSDLVGFDIYRVENGKVAEHWDNLTPLAPANPSGRTQTDGPTEIADHSATTANKAVVKGFIETVLIGLDYTALTQFINETNYAQHNSGIADGLDGLSSALAEMARQGVTMEYDALHLMVAEGNFVLAVSEGRFAGVHSAFYDLFRLEAGKIVEHWDVISEIPSEMAHTNGKF